MAKIPPARLLLPEDLETQLPPPAVQVTGMHLQGTSHLGHALSAVQLALMPFVRPVRWSYLVFTYLIPLIPFSLFWDVIVSFLRVYSLEQMAAMTEDLQAPGYSWEIGRIQVRGVPDGLPYLIGRPIK